MQGGVQSAHHAQKPLQVFFVQDKAMPGWSVVLKKEARGRRIGSMEEDHVLGQEGSTDDLQVLTSVESEGGRRGDYLAGEETSATPGLSRRRRRNDAT